MDIAKYFQKKEEKKTIIIDNKLIINCKNCEKNQTLDNNECILCLTKNISNVGDVTTVVFGDSIEQSLNDSAFEVLKELSHIYKTVDKNTNYEKRCQNCDFSLKTVMEEEMNNFPDIETLIPYQKIKKFDNEDDNCKKCKDNTIKILDNLKKSLFDLNNTIKGDI